MRFLHEKKPVPILHGDLKTSNLLLEDDGRVVIADFGLASSMRSGMGESGAQAGALTVSISPPEVLRDPMAPRTAAGDVYAFAIVLLEIMTGRGTFRGMRAPDVKRLVCEGNRPPIPGYLPAGVADIISACWAQEPADRPSFAVITQMISEAMADVQMMGTAIHDTTLVTQTQY